MRDGISVSLKLILSHSRAWDWRTTLFYSRREAESPEEASLWKEKHRLAQAQYRKANMLKLRTQAWQYRWVRTLIFQMPFWVNWVTDSWNFQTGQEMESSAGCRWSRVCQIHGAGTLGFRTMICRRFVAQAYRRQFSTLRLSYHLFQSLLVYQYVIHCTPAFHWWVTTLCQKGHLIGSSSLTSLNRPW